MSTQSEEVFAPEVQVITVPYVQRVMVVAPRVTLFVPPGNRWMQSL